MSTDTSDLEVGTRWGAMKNKVRALGFLAVHNVLQKLRPEALKNSVSFRVFAAIALDRLIGRDAMSRLVSLYLPLRQFLQFNSSKAPAAAEFDANADYDLLDGRGRQARWAHSSERTMWDVLPADEKNHTLRYCLFLLATLVTEAAMARVGTLLAGFAPVRSLQRFAWDSNQLKLVRAVVFFGLWSQPRVLQWLQRSLQTACFDWNWSSERSASPAGSNCRSRPLANLAVPHSGFWDEIDFPRDVVPVEVSADDGPDGMHGGTYSKARVLRRSSGGFQGSTTTSSGGVRWLGKNSLQEQSAQPTARVALTAGTESVAAAVDQGDTGCSSSSFDAAETTMEREQALESTVDWAVLQQCEAEDSKLNATNGPGSAPCSAVRGTPLRSRRSSERPGDVATADVFRSAKSPAPVKPAPPPPSRGTKPRVSAWLGAGRPSVGYNRLHLGDGVPQVETAGPDAKARATAEVVSSTSPTAAELSMSSLDLVVAGSSADSSLDSVTGLPIGADFPQNTSNDSVDAAGAAVHAAENNAGEINQSSLAALGTGEDSLSMSSFSLCASPPLASPSARRRYVFGELNVQRS